jgi:hypothetical protein
MLNNLLSNRVEYMYCINCQHNDMILEDVSGKKFHVYYQTFHSKAKPVECLGPFAHNEPPQEYQPLIEEIDIEQLAEATFSNMYQYPSIEEIQVDRILFFHQKDRMYKVGL